MTDKNNKSISLPKPPEGKEFEEYISAFFQSAGHFIERNIVERDIEEVLELDIIATDYHSNASPPKIRLIEVKSGSFGFSDLFKLLGWMYYLNQKNKNINNGIFIVKKERNNVDFFKEKAKKLNIDVQVIPDLNKSNEVFSNYLINRPSIEDIDTWRLSYWVERKLLERLINKKKSNPDKKCYKALSDYYFKVNSETFFPEDILGKTIPLYSTFEENSHISARCGRELMGVSFDEYEYWDTLPKEIYSDTYYKCNYNDIQISTFIEHRARLAILKNAVDYILIQRSKEQKIPSKTRGIEHETSSISGLPESFVKGLKNLSSHTYFHRYPVFWQWFMWAFGGFILKDYEKEEYKILSQKTGIPVEEIPNALKSYEILFPLNKGWFIDVPQSNIKLMKMFSVPFMGIGAKYRTLIYTESREFKDLKLNESNTLDHLIKWKNLTENVLKSKP